MGSAGGAKLCTCTPLDLENISLCQAENNIIINNTFLES